MNDDIDRMGGMDPDAEEPEEPQDVFDRIYSHASQFLDPDLGRGEPPDPEYQPFTLEIDPRVIDRMEDLFDFDQFDPTSMFINSSNVQDWSDVRGQHFATQLGALEYIIQGGMTSFARIFYDEESDDWRVLVDY